MSDENDVESKSFDMRRKVWSWMGKDSINVDLDKRVRAYILDQMMNGLEPRGLDVFIRYSVDMQGRITYKVVEERDITVIVNDDWNPPTSEVVKNEVLLMRGTLQTNLRIRKMLYGD